MPDDVRRIAGRYELLEQFNHGGMGDIWRGYDAVLDRPVAVKLIRPQAVTSPHLAEEFEKRFRREARVTARIQHPGVPQVYDAVLDESYEQLFLVMELVDGVPLTAYVRPGQQPPLPLSWAVSVAAQVATVLSYAHDVPVVHRDLKPGNILVARDGTVKVLDFGIAAILRTDVTKLTATGSPIGTHQYMAPEQVRGARVTPRTDLYALGCVLHELLGGRPLFAGDSEWQLMMQHINAAPTPLRQLRSDVPEALEELVLHLLRKAPEARPADVQEVYERLRPYLPVPGEEPAPEAAGPAGAPDPTGIFRRPYAPRARTGTTGARPAEAAVAPDAPPAVPAAEREALREQIREVYAHYVALMEEERYAQATEVVDEMIEPAARALGSESRAVLRLRTWRAVSRQLAGDHRAALPEFEALADAYARVGGPSSEEALDSRAQAARCRGELGQVTEALAGLNGVLDAVRAIDGDVSENAVELRRDIGMLLLAQQRAAEAYDVLEPLHSDLCVVFGPDDELTAEVAETLAVIRLDLDGPGY
ncbi:serine/threonine-protein kinase [Streptomyces capillispiralis]|uniref:non-specific serine/threonine protein kinase n=1 Tax=Streptomyces capillispiralis TaxID=68182 RepID=A0A561TA04_9ACTN|nr:serine/threonine-protein kinase [Streptomyces capillispiralis]TWF83955.1 serine/threonine protein kinase [Streptomyces capillispiralis]GHH95051.1 protein kinase [Streptomyces capillispiralis]